MCAHPASPLFLHEEEGRRERTERRAVAIQRCPTLPALRGGKRVSASQLAPALRQGAQAQRIEADEPLRIVLIVGGGAVLERHEILIVERIGALAADHRSLALVKLEPHPAADE